MCEGGPTLGCAVCAKHGVVSSVSPLIGRSGNPQKSLSNEATRVSSILNLLIHKSAPPFSTSILKSCVDGSTKSGSSPAREHSSACKRRAQRGPRRALSIQLQQLHSPARLASVLCMLQARARARNSLTGIQGYSIPVAVLRRLLRRRRTPHPGSAHYRRCAPRRDHRRACRRSGRCCRESCGQAHLARYRVNLLGSERLHSFRSTKRSAGGAYILSPMGTSRFSLRSLSF